MIKLIFILLLYYVYNIKTSEYGIKFLLENEGFDPEHYDDIANVDTIGYGFTSAIESLLGKKFETLTTLTKEESLSILQYILEHRYESLVNKYDIIYNFNQNQYDALVSFAYNIGNIDGLTNYGTRTIEEISSHFLSYVNVNGNFVQGLENRRKKEKELFDKPIELNITVQININHYESCTGSYIFGSTLKNKDINTRVLGKYQSEKDIGVIFYDPQTTKFMKSKCHSYYINEINCIPYYPIQEGEYIIKLEKNGYFDDGTVVLPFDLTNDMYSKDEDRRIKIYNTNFQIPLHFTYSNYNYLFRNYFFYRGKISFYNKSEIIKSTYPVQVNLSYCFINHSCANENNYQINCQVTKLRIDRYDDNFGDYLLTCKGNINTNVYNIKHFGGAIEIRYKIGESSLQELEVGLLVPINFIIHSPRDILEVNSYEYIFSNSSNIFKFYGKSLNNKIIRNIGSQNNLCNFNIYFSGGFYSSHPSSSCYLYSNDNNNNFIIECFLGDIYYDNEIINYVIMEEEFINELNNEFDVILPFEFYVTQEVKKIEKDYSNYCGDYVENVNSNVCRTFPVRNNDYICDI